MQARCGHGSDGALFAQLPPGVLTVAAALLPPPAPVETVGWKAAIAPTGAPSDHFHPPHS